MAKQQYPRMRKNQLNYPQGLIRQNQIQTQQKILKMKATSQIRKL
jgi:hypothetical protein